MNASDYRDWMIRGFYAVKGELLRQLVRQQIYNSEELVRTTFTDGLLLAEPNRAHLLDTEHDVGWHGAPCWNDPAHGTPGSGRKPQHDVAVIDANGATRLVCEVKWLKKKNAKTIARDVWRVVMTRGDATFQSGKRCFLLVGGLKDAFQPSLDELSDEGFKLKWSRRATKGQKLPDTYKVNLQKLASGSIGNAALLDTLTWSKKTHHVRTPPDCCDEMRVRVCESWEQTCHIAGEVRVWRLVLWELDNFDCSGNINWPAVRGQHTFKC